MTVTVPTNPTDVLLWILAAITFGVTALVFFVIAFLERSKRWTAESKYVELGLDVKNFVKNHLLEKYERQAVLDFINNNEPGMILFHVFGYGRYTFYLHPKPEEENGSFSDRGA